MVFIVLLGTLYRALKLKLTGNVCLFISELFFILEKEPFQMHSMQLSILNYRGKHSFYFIAKNVKINIHVLAKIIMSLIAIEYSSNISRIF